MTQVAQEFGRSNHRGKSPICQALSQRDGLGALADNRYAVATISAHYSNPYWIWQPSCLCKDVFDLLVSRLLEFGVALAALTASTGVGVVVVHLVVRGIEHKMRPPV